MITLDELRTVLKDPDHAEDSYIVGLELAAVAYAERQTGRYLGASRERSEVIVGSGNANLWLPGPIESVTTVKERAYAGGEETTIATGDEDGWVIRGDRLVRKGGGHWFAGYEYEVEYTQGYAAGSEPADIRQAVLQLVTLWFTQRLPVALGAVAPEVPHSVAAILRSYWAPKA